MSTTHQINVTTGESTMTINWHSPPCQCCASKIDMILVALAYLKQKVHEMSGTLDDLKTRVASNTTIVGSAITLLQGLKARLDAAGTDPAALAALSAELGSTDQQLADAIAANTPASPAPPADATPPADTTPPATA